MRIESRLDLSSIRWLRETDALAGTEYTRQFWSHVQHSAFPSHSVVAIEVDNDTIGRAWILESYVVGHEIPTDLVCPDRPVTPPNTIVLASSVQPGTKSKPFVPNSNTNRYYSSLPGPPARFFDRWSAFLDDKVIVYRVSRLTRVRRFLYRCFLGVVNLFRRGK
jgi:hypothetical protein